MELYLIQNIANVNGFLKDLYHLNSLGGSTAYEESTGCQKIDRQLQEVRLRLDTADKGAISGRRPALRGADSVAQEVCPRHALTVVAHFFVIQVLACKGNVRSGRTEKAASINARSYGKLRNGY